MKAINRARIVAFMKDENTAEAVFEAIRDSFLKDKGTVSVHELAAQTLSVQFLKKAWRELESLRNETEKEPSSQENIGL